MPRTGQIVDCGFRWIPNTFELPSRRVLPSLRAVPDLVSQRRKGLRNNAGKLATLKNAEVNRIACGIAENCIINVNYAKVTSGQLVKYNKRHLALPKTYLQTVAPPYCD